MEQIDSCSGKMMVAQGSFSVIDFSITSLKVPLKSKSVCWSFDMRVPAGPLQIQVRIRIIDCIVKVSISKPDYCLKRCIRNKSDMSEKDGLDYRATIAIFTKYLGKVYNYRVFPY